MRATLVALGLVCAPLTVHADEIPTVTLTDAGPTRDVPTHRSFFVTGDVRPTVTSAQAVVVRKGSPSLFGDDGPNCREVMSQLHVDAHVSIGDDDDDDSDDTHAEPPLASGKRVASEVFPRAEPALRDDEVLVSAPWLRDSDAQRYELLVPHDTEFFSAGYAYCMFVIASERSQQLSDASVSTLVDRVARDIVSCGDKSSCDDDALSDFAMRTVRDVATARTLGGGIAALTVSSSLKDAARSELANSSAIIEARDHLQDRWSDDSVMQPLDDAAWLDPTTDPFARALVAALARTEALLPQVRSDKHGSSVEVWTADGKLPVRVVQLLDDGHKVRVASSRSPTGDQVRVLSVATDALAVADGVSFYDLIELGRGRIHVDRDAAPPFGGGARSGEAGPSEQDWLTLAALRERVSAVGLDWSDDDSTFLAAAGAQLRRLADFVDDVGANAKCTTKPVAPGVATISREASAKALGEWLACQQIDMAALDARAEQLDELSHADQGWRSTKDGLIARAKRIATVTVTAPIETRVAFARPTWVFSYVTPFVGYAGVVRPDESFGLFYAGVQLHLDPNPVEDILWRDGVTPKDLRRALALEVGVAPYGGSFGPEQRYSGLGGVPPVFVGLAIHVVPYTSFTFGGTILDHKNSSLPQEQAQAIFTPYIGVTLQLNIPDLVRLAVTPRLGHLGGAVTRALLPVMLALAACEGLSASPEPSVSVFVKTSDSCFALMTPNQPVSTALGVGGLCPYDAPAQLVAGIDLAEAVIDYGPDVEFAPNTAAPPPTVSVTADGMPSDQPVTMSEEQRVGSRAFFIATFRAPSEASRDVQITAGVNPGFQTTVPVTFVTLPPVVSLSVVECALTTTCDVPGGVGQIHIAIEVPGDLSVTVPLHETLDGVTQPDPIAPVVTTPAGATSTAIAAVPVPPAPAGTGLELFAQINAGPVNATSATIVAPDITAALTCGSSCGVGTTTGLTITAPAGISATDAILDATLDGVPDIIEQDVPLQVLGSAATGLATLQVPAQAGTWALTVSVDGYVEQISATVQ